MSAEYDKTAPREERCVLIAKSMIVQNATVRSIASQFGISKSTVHKDLVERLPRVHPGLFAEVRELLSRNKAERHLRGGEATRKKYLADMRRMRK